MVSLLRELRALGAALLAPKGLPEALSARPLPCKVLPHQEPLPDVGVLTSQGGGAMHEIWMISSIIARLES